MEVAKITQHALIYTVEPELKAQLCGRRAMTLRSLLMPACLSLLTLAYCAEMHFCSGLAPPASPRWTQVMCLVW